MSTKSSETIKAGMLRGSGGRETGDEGEVVFVMFMSIWIAARLLGRVAGLYFAVAFQNSLFTHLIFYLLLF